MTNDMMQLQGLIEKGADADVLRGLTHRGLSDVRLVISNNHSVVKAAVSKVLTASLARRTLCPPP